MGRDDGDDYPGGRANEQGSFPSTTVGRFWLDKYEVSVGRFRAFVEQFDGTLPPIGSGSVAYVADDLKKKTGWKVTWNEALPKTREGLLLVWRSRDDKTWTEMPGGDATESYPINYVDWYLAQAFCIWDGGRLPTEAEWEFAAAGGTDNRVFPWSLPRPDGGLGDAGDAGDVTDAGDADADHSDFPCAQWNTAVSPSIQPVGSYLAGAGRWEHVDLAGNVAEWVFDGYEEHRYNHPCVNCVYTSNDAQRVIRGGSYLSKQRSDLRSAARVGEKSGTNTSAIGFRCAYDVTE